jgi:hypothetical protein
VPPAPAASDDPTPSPQSPPPPEPPDVLTPAQLAALDREIDALPPLTDQQIDTLAAIIIANRNRRLTIKPANPPGETMNPHPARPPPRGSLGGGAAREPTGRVRRCRARRR